MTKVLLCCRCVFSFVDKKRLYFVEGYTQCCHCRC